MPAGLLSGLLRHDRAVVLSGLAVVIALSWGYLLLGAGFGTETMDMGGGQMMAMRPAWTPGYAALIFAMWVVMMVAMMLPGAAPIILLVASLARNRATLPGTAAALFASGYLVVWCGFGLAATLLQWGLDELGVLSPTMAVGNRALAGGTLLAAGIYQWTPLKDTCLSHCRSPLAFLVKHWRSGPLGILLTGMRHGVFCLGCCWMLMVLLFVGGLMNLVWIAAIALFVLLEKVLPWGGRMSRITGLALVAWGAVTLTSMI